jgi:cation transporter-like permease
MAVAGNTVTVTGPVLVAAGVLESVALTVMVVDPAVVGVPVITQLADKLSPAGSVPAVRLQV